MLFNDSGINIEKFSSLIDNSEKANLETFISKAIKLCNKIACADVYENYKNLKNVAKKYGTSFLFETNVGAGLPIIDTLNNLVNSGDKIISIQAILSGSLNYIFNNYNVEKKLNLMK